MTCIVGIRDKKRVYIGGDSAVSADAAQALIGDKKVFLNDGIAFGICGSPKVLDPLRFEKFPKQQRSESVREYVAFKLVPAIQAALEKAGCVVDDPQHGHIFHGAALLGVKNELYRLEANFQVFTTQDGTDAVGSGGRVAEGSLSATANVRDPRKRILQALEAAAGKDSYVRPPFFIVTTR